MNTLADILLWGHTDLCVLVPIAHTGRKDIMFSPWHAYRRRLYAGPYDDPAVEVFNGRWLPLPGEVRPDDIRLLDPRALNHYETRICFIWVHMQTAGVYSSRNDRTCLVVCWVGFYIQFLWL